MTTHDEQIIRRDRALPGLRIVLDPRLYAETLRASDAPFRTIDATMSYIRYKPGQSCLVGYELDTDCGLQRVYTKAYRASETRKFAKANERFSADGKSPGGGLVDERLMIIHTFFPQDARLRALRRLKTQDGTARLLRAMFVPSSPMRAGSIETMLYKPERRFVGRLDVEGQPAAVVKFYTAAAFRGLVARSSAFHDAGPLHLPALVGQSERYSSLAFEWLGGKRLTEALLDGSADPGMVHRLGTALAMMHGQAGEGLPLHTARDERMHLRGIAASLSFLLPERACYFRRVVDRVLGAMGRCRLRVRPTHGDFYADQVLVDGDFIQLLDFDESVLDDPLMDVGNFIAHLQYDRLSCGQPADALDDYVEAFLEGYRENAGGWGNENLAPYTAACILKLALHPFRFREEEWPSRVLALISCAESCLDRPERALPSVVATLSAPLIDGAMPFLNAALDPRFAESRLHSLHSAGRVHVRRVELVRHKIGRRCMIAYYLHRSPGEAADTVWLGKVRAKGLDRATYDLTRALWDGPFGRTNDSVAVAEPVGVVPAFNMWLQRKEAGANAAERLRGADGAVVAGWIAEALRALHRSGVAVSRTHTLADELGILEERLQLLMLERPEWANRLTDILSACEREALALPAPNVGPIHRDFYADNVLVDGRRIVLLDLDLHAMGDPALDAGNFIAHLVEQGLREAGDASLLEEQAAAFLEAYVLRAPDVRHHSIETYTTLALVRLIHISTLFPQRRRYTGALVQLCEARLGLGRPHPFPLSAGETPS